MRKNNLLAAAAIAGLIGGTSLAIGQSSNSSGVGSGNAGAGPAAPSSAERSSPNSGPTAGSSAKQSSEQRSETGSSAAGSQSSERRNQAAGQTGTAGEAGQASSPDRDGRSGATANSGSAATHGSASLTSEQRTKIRQTIVRQGNAPRVANVNFSVSVGTTVPRSVRLVAVPAPIVEIQPDWRGYEYFMVGDQVVIVDPDTMQIVAIISA